MVSTDVFESILCSNDSLMLSLHLPYDIVFSLS